MSYETCTFYRPVCDYPGCGIRYEGTYYDGSYHKWWQDLDNARENVWDNPWWLTLDDDGGQARFFCPAHLRFDQPGPPVRFDPDDDKCLPRNGGLIPYYLDSWMQPLPKLECEDTIREILKGDGK
ncbi:hypothetical protein [Bifidobacterium panos]|uniref:Uncharacterized protein n=1 Tax=Bifidobacterium panos TaxID=2675321 RepID=A0ABX1SY32_9BIFI|nr:hypothetical protein [Bifidobacterium sp. DSM 109963]NMN02746.1 hypothetical protein [Bifidobacterium sp. DSM 109963]